MRKRKARSEVPSQSQLNQLLSSIPSARASLSIDATRPARSGEAVEGKCSAAPTRRRRGGRTGSFAFVLDDAAEWLTPDGDAARMGAFRWRP